MSDLHTTVQYQLRLSNELREKIRVSSEKNNRSMNSEINLRLERSFAQDDSDEVIGVSFDQKWLGDSIDPEKLSKAINYLFNKAIEEDMAKDKLEKDI